MEQNYWILTISEDNIQLVFQNNLIGMPSGGERLARKINDGDKIIFYIGKTRAGRRGSYPMVLDFGPVAEVVGEPFYDQTKIWNSKDGEIYPWRRRISILLNGRIKVRDVLGELSFVKNRERWGLYFFHALRQISEDDYIVLTKAIKNMSSKEVKK